MILTYEDKLKSKDKLTNLEHAWLNKEREDREAIQKEKDNIGKVKSIYIFSNRQKRMNTYRSIIMDSKIQEGMVNYVNNFLGIENEPDEDGHIDDVESVDHIQRMKFYYPVDRQFSFNMFGFDFSFKLLHETGKGKYKGVIETHSNCYFNGREWGFFINNHDPVGFKDIWIATNYFGIEKGYLKRRLVDMINVG